MDFSRPKLEPRKASNQDACMSEILDLRGLKCPLPAMLAKKALARLSPGTVVTVLADDPLAAVDIPHMCHGEGHAVESVTARDGYTEFALKTDARPHV
jgi:tRNA 2-thiouridine synthesizing protein A